MRLIDSFGLGNAMRGEDQCLEHFFTYVRLEDRIPADHPLRAIHELVDAALKELSQPFAKLYAREGRPSIPPERLLRALLLQAFYTVRSERQVTSPAPMPRKHPEPTPIIRAARSRRCGDLTTSQSCCYPVSTSRSNCKTSIPELREILRMGILAKIKKLLVGESVVGDGNEVAQTKINKLLVGESLVGDG